jgi:cysteinyl-tRNA synthetase
LGDLGAVKFPDVIEHGISSAAWELIRNAPQDETDDTPGEDILALVEARQHARVTRDWPESDRIRNELTARGWMVKDTPEGPLVTRIG